MTSETDREDCARRCWQMAGAAGVGLFLILWALTPLGFLMSLLFGIFAYVGVGLGLIYTRCASVAVPAPKPAPKVEAAKPAPEVKAEPAVKPEPVPAPKAEPAPAPKAEDTVPPEPEIEPGEPKTVAESVAAGYGAVRPSAALAGQQELAGRKGNWRYGAAPSGIAPAGAPARMDAPRAGGADNLKKIKGIGPKLEQLLNSMGFYHFDQIAGWSTAEIAWVDENLEGFKGRVTRDDWVAQAKTLAAGGETEFSRRSK